MTGFTPHTLRIALLVYPGFTALDLFGPHHMLAGLMPDRLDLVAATRDPVTSDTRATVIPSAAFDDIEPGLDVLLVPGGTSGTLTAMADPVTRAFLARQGAAARVVASVCTGALLLGTAGLLTGRRATTHWLALDLLSRFGAVPIAERVVEDGNLVTGAGVSAGLDLGLALVRRFAGDHHAGLVQLAAEYDPAPPLSCGSPALAPAALVGAARQHFSAFVAAADAATAGGAPA